MATKADTDRKANKAKAIERRLLEMSGHLDLLIGMLDEEKLDLLILALGIGSVTLNDEEE